jgi:uncharacterized protein YjlB
VVALYAAGKQADVVTSDSTDIERLARCAGGTGRILEV